MTFAPCFLWIFALAPWIRTESSGGIVLLLATVAAVLIFAFEWGVVRVLASCAAGGLILLLV